MNTNQQQGWVLTDLDTNQYYKQLNETTFLYKEDSIMLIAECLFEMET
ncbi:MAG: hypothetical protein HS119_11390 [Flavobacteriales bacterium]|nr:hypothetical protein [Flavobacteriales bacterium]